MASTLKTEVVQNPSSATVNLTLDASGGVAAGQNLSVAGTTTLTGAVTLSTNATSSGTVVMSSPYTMRNKIINGAMVIDQRNAGASVTPTNAQYLVDRFSSLLTQASKYSVQQNAGSVTPPTGFSNYLGITSLSAYSVASGDVFGIRQRIEGFNVADLAWGTASAISVTLSFWVRSSLTGTFGGYLQNSAGNRSYPFTYTISSANTWEQKSVIISGDTTGTWLTNNGIGIELGFSLGVGSTYSGTAGVWAAANYNGATGATSVVGTNGATFYITGVQLERGTVATPFEYRNYQQELAMCMRYYEQTDSLASYIGAATVIGASVTYTSGVRWNTKKRTAPTVVIYNRAGTAAKLSIVASGSSAGTTVTAINSDTLGAQTCQDSGNGLVAGTVYELCYTASAEL